MPGYFAINCSYEILLKRKQVCQFASLLSSLYVHPKSRDSQLGRVPDYSVPSPLAESSASFAPVEPEWLLKRCPPKAYAYLLFSKSHLVL